MTILSHTSELWAQEHRQYRVLFGLTFIVVWAIALAARLLPVQMRPWPPVSGRRLSIFAEARAVTQRVLPFAFL
jgi:hypothetical protein